MAFSYVFLTVRLLSAVPRGRPRLGARRTRAPSTITQYEYYSPYSPDGVQKIFGTPPAASLAASGERAPKPGPRRGSAPGRGTAGYQSRWRAGRPSWPPLP